METVGSILLWGLVGVAGLLLLVTSSTRAVVHATAIAHQTSIPPFVIGLTLVALGTDLPEIANSVVSSVRDHGDLNVGDSVGSAIAQITMVLGIVPFVAGALVVAERRIELVGGLVAMALGLVAILVSDGFLSRTDALVLILTWVAAQTAAWRLLPAALTPPPSPTSGRSVGYHAATALVALALVGGGAVATIEALIRLTSTLGVSEFLISFFAVAIGTSLPELVVAITAARSGETQMAMGDAFGASLTDATLSIGAGPLIAPVAVTASLGVRGAIIAMVAAGIATLILSTRRKLSRPSGALLLVVYLLSIPVLLTT